MTIYLFLPLLVLSVNATLIPIVLWGRVRQRTHRVFALFLLSMALWGATVFLMRFSATPEQTWFWNKLAMIELPLTVVLFLKFTYLFSGQRISRIGYATSHAIVPVVAVLAFAGLITDGIQIKLYGYAPAPGGLLLLYLVLVYSCISVALRNLISIYHRTTSQAQRNQAGYLITATCFLLLGTTANWLPLLVPGIYPLGILGSILFSVLASVTIIRHRLLDIHVALRRSIRFSLVIILMAGLYLLASLVIQQISGSNYFTASFGVSVGVMVAVYLIFSPLLGKVQDGIDRAFLKRRWGPLQELLRFTAETRNVNDFNTLAAEFLQLVKRAMDTDAAVLLISRLDNEASWSSPGVGSDANNSDRLNNNCPWLQRLAKEHRAYLAQEVFPWPEWQYAPSTVRAQVQGLDIEVFLPLSHRGEMTGLLLIGSKNSRRGYGLEELQLLGAVARQAAPILAYAHLYEDLHIQLRVLKETQAHLLQSGKLASLGTLAAGIAHEVNNPLFAISGIAELLLSSPGLHLRSQQATEYVRVIFNMSDRITQAVRGMLGFSRIDVAAIPVSLNDVADDALRLMEHKLRSGGITVERRYYSGLPPTRAVANQLQQALMNLIINAGDAMGKAGTLTLLTGVSGRRVWVSCCDTGSGISEDARDKIFDAFFTTKGVGQGTGLGLYLTHRIVENFGGEIACESREGVGTTFTIYLPICSVETADPDLDDLRFLTEPGPWPGSRDNAKQPTGGFGLDPRRRP